MPPMPHRRGLFSESLHVIREARAPYRRLAVLWSMGKDSDTAHPQVAWAGLANRPRSAAAGDQCPGGHARLRGGGRYAAAGLAAAT
jgi:hypothetical protein